MKITLIIFVFLDIAEQHASDYVWHLVAIIRKEVSEIKTKSVAKGVYLKCPIMKINLNKVANSNSQDLTKHGLRTEN